RVLVHAGVTAFHQCELMLRLYETAADLDRVKLVSADASVEDFLTARFCVKKPLAALLDDGYGKRPIVLADRENCVRGALRIYRDILLLASLCGKLHRNLPIANRFASVNDFLAAGAENLFERGRIKLLCRVNQRIRSLIGCRECSGFSSGTRRCLLTCLRRRAERQQTRKCNCAHCT